MPASIVTLSALNGVQRFFCPFCAATVFDEEDGMAEEFCEHVKVFVDWIGEPNFPAGSPSDLADASDEIDVGDPSELSALFGDDMVIFELLEPGRGGGHDASSCLVAIAVVEETV